MHRFEADIHAAVDRILDRVPRHERADGPPDGSETVRLALAEIRRAKLRFGLLIGAVALLVFLILFQQTLAGALLGSVHRTGSGTSRPRSWSSTPTRAAQRRGQRRHAGAGRGGARGARRRAGRAARRGRPSRSTSGRHLTDTTIFGYVLGGPGAPTTLVEGRLPEADGEAVASDVDAAKGYGIGDTVPGRARRHARSRIVGLASDAQFNVQPTLYRPYATYEELSRRRTRTRRGAARRSWRCIPRPTSPRSAGRVAINDAGRRRRGARPGDRGRRPARASPRSASRSR